MEFYIALAIISTVILLSFFIIIIIKKNQSKSLNESRTQFNEQLLKIQEENERGLNQSNKLLTEITNLKNKNKKLEQELANGAVKEIIKEVPENKQLIIEENKKSILVVDDSMVVRNKMRRLLENAGYDITTANDGAEALKVLFDKSYSLVITDLEMPNMNGFELIAAISANYAIDQIPVIAITGHEEMPVKISECEALYGMCKKPWKDEELIKRVEFLCALKQ